MMTYLTVCWDFVLANWMVLTVVATLVGGWLLICQGLCSTAEPERDADEPHPRRFVGTRSRLVLSSHRQTHRVHPHASFRSRRS
jgi:hypothetical protein